MVKHNNEVPNQHFKKKWQFNVKTWFNQPARKVRRRKARAEKAAKLFPRPAAGPLRPVVHSQTVKYNQKVRLGRGFTLEELKEAGIAKNVAPTIGIAVDHRRRNRSVESLQANVQRLKAYKANLVIFPKKSSAPKEGEASKEEMAAAQQHAGPIMPPKKEAPTVEYGQVTGDMLKQRAYEKLRVERMNAKREGLRKKRAAEAAAEKDAKQMLWSGPSYTQLQLLRCSYDDDSVCPKRPFFATMVLMSSLQMHRSQPTACIKSGAIQTRVFCSKSI
eukprot:TRINITY_DN714_c0_g1_i1.p1 TRINITY_DN714_c0_g1~~TRINITY_DN714_c0_g1_i1.p1  ORF type:complete len:310 (+),score=20.84 TRINITY_DN714_c0_g1_i1:106-930(+)